MASKGTETQAMPGPQGMTQVQWDTSKMETAYANVCNATGTREEVVLYFGVSQPTPAGQPDLTVQVSDRIILSPFAAKRLAQLLGNVVQAYEGRFGPLPAGPDAADASSESSN